MLTFRDQAFLAGLRGGFQPPDLTDLVLWVKPESLGALSNNDPVTTWPDSSGYGNNLGQTTIGQKPLYKTNQLNGWAGVEFDGINDVITGPQLTANTTYTMFLVLKFNSAVGTEVPFRHGELAGYGFYKGVGNRTVLHRNVADCVDAAATTNPELWSAVRTSAPLLRFFVNGGSQAVTNDTSNVLPPDAITYMGQFNPGAGLFFAGQIYEAAVYRTALSDVNRQLWETYLLNKYAL